MRTCLSVLMNRSRTAVANCKHSERGVSRHAVRSTGRWRKVALTSPPRTGEARPRSERFLDRNSLGGRHVGAHVQGRQIHIAPKLDRVTTNGQNGSDAKRKSYVHLFGRY